MGDFLDSDLVLSGFILFSGQSPFTIRGRLPKGKIAQYGQQTLTIGCGSYVAVTAPSAVAITIGTLTGMLAFLRALLRLTVKFS